MKNILKGMVTFALSLMVLFSFEATAQAKEADTVKTGIFAEDIDLSGMTAAEATAAIESYLEKLQERSITLLAADNNEVVVTAGELGITWTNKELVEEAMELGTKGNVIQRYKVLKDLEHSNQVFPIEISFDIHAINDLLANECAKYDREAVNVSLKREDGEFQVVEGQKGYLLDIETSIDIINNYLTGEWDRKDCEIALDIAVDEPQGNAELLAEVTDVLGSFTTSYTSSGSSRSANVENGTRLVDGITLYPGEEFSTYQAVAPFSKENGYYMAGSYMNGRVVDSLGGGICQVSTTLYNAVLLAELDVTERHNHSMSVAYVDPSADAAIAESSGKDFKFVNNTEYPIYIEGYVKNKHVTFNIYGKETRDEGRKVVYKSEILEVINPPADLITPNPSQPIGYIVSESAHIGYKAKLWKIVTEDGVEVSRTQVNSSSYKMVPRSASVGTATADPAAYEEIMAAIGTANLDHVKNVIAILTSQSVVDTAAQPGV